MKEVRLRFAPSPTGYLHIGGLRTALYNYLYARGQKGKFILRIEDTDRTRFVEDALENLIKVLDWSGLSYDEGPMLEDGKIVEKGNFGPYIQSDRKNAGIYDRYIQKLLDEDKAYYCFCSPERLDKVREEQRQKGETPRYDGHCRYLSKEEIEEKIKAKESYVIRLKLPKNLDLTFHDAIKGDITINTDEMDDQVLIKSDGFPTYHFAVVVDDHEMKISHIVRGEEWISSTPKHIFLYDAFGWPRPEYVHLPTILGSDHKKLSKRTGDVAVEQFIAKGYTQLGLINYIALVGWTPKGNQEILSMDEMIEQFDFDRVSKTGGIYDVEKLNWVNQKYITEMPLEEASREVRKYLEAEGLVDESTPEEKIQMATEIYQNRIEHFAQVPEMMKHLFVGSKGLFFNESAKEALKEEEAKGLINLFEEKISTHDLTEDFANGVVKSLQKETGIKGKKLWFPVRAAVVGDTSGPDFGKTLLILGKKEILARLELVKKEYVVEEEK